MRRSHMGKSDVERSSVHPEPRGFSMVDGFVVSTIDLLGSGHSLHNRRGPQNTNPESTL